MKEKNSVWSVILRYFFLALVALPGFNLFYFVFLPLTLYPVYFLLNLFFNATLVGNMIFINLFTIEIIGACVAGSAYYFLLIINLAIPGIKPLKRLKMVGFSFGILLIINLLRIFLLSIMYVSGSSLFDFTHKLFWYLGSTVIVIAIWFLEVKVFKIKKVPFYSDLKALYRKSSLKK